MALTLIRDTREQLGYRFDTPCVDGTLAIGDYSVAGLQDLVSVERKELGDLIQCLSSDRIRFERELHRGRSLDHFAVVVEGTLEDIAKHRYRSEMLPKAVLQSLITFSVRYRLPIWFAGTREYGQRLTESILLKYGREIEKRMEAMEKADAK